MFNIVLYQPEIPPNTGNILRLSANTGCRLHLVEPLGFRTDAASLRRAGLDYDVLADVRRHRCWEDCRAALGGQRLFAASTRGETRHDQPHYVPGDAFVFGPESRGLPQDILAALPPDQRLRLPMIPGNRSLNLSNAVAIVIYEAWRQNGFAGSAINV
jgi:tRNA (cytidine/uridine-2'-O-)-methyltransferase